MNIYQAIPTVKHVWNLIVQPYPFITFRNGEDFDYGTGKCQATLRFRGKRCTVFCRGLKWSEEQRKFAAHILYSEFCPDVFKGLF